jgi:hypothetical protein
MKKFFKIMGIIFLVLAVLLAAGLIYFNLSYPKTDPAPNIKVNASPEKLERGKFCNACCNVRGLPLTRD